MPGSKDPKRTTIYFDPEIHKALRLKAAEADSTVSEIVNEAVRCTLREDLIDARALGSRKGEPARSFEEFVEEMSKSGIL